MLFAILIAAITCLCMIAAVLFFPTIKIKRISFASYWVITLIGALILLFSGTLDVKAVGAAIIADNAINPLKILVLFISMTVLSIFLDELGFFKYLANCALRRAGNSQVKLFIMLYATVSVLTVFTSNDIIILSFTPFVCYFARNAKIDPLPYLTAEFVAANTWSMALMIGNPTNIYLMTGTGESFLRYTAVMAIPTILAGAVSFVILRLLFAKDLKKPLESSCENIKIEDKTLTLVALLHLSACIILMAVSSYLDLPMWLISFAFCMSLFVVAFLILLFRKQGFSKISETFSHAPYEIIPFVISMFVLVLALGKVGMSERLASLLSCFDPVYGYGISSFLGANLINNIPMSVLFSS